MFICLWTSLITDYYFSLIYEKCVKQLCTIQKELWFDWYNVQDISNSSIYFLQFNDKSVNTETFKFE